MGFLKKSYAGVIFAFLYAPILVLIIFSFNNSKSRGSWDGFTLKWYEQLFQSSEIATALYYTMSVAILSAILATLIGTLAALAIHYQIKHPLEKSAVMNLTYLPVLNSDIVTGISLMLLFIFLKIDLGFLSMLTAHTVFNVPYVILAILPKLKQFNGNLYEAALDLGASPFYAFRRVVLPEILPGIVTGALLAFTLSIDDFVISFFTTGSGVNNLSILIYSMARRGINPTINALSTLLFAAVLFLLLVVNKRIASDEKDGRLRQ